jgi:hypothetical protein
MNRCTTVIAILVAAMLASAPDAVGTAVEPHLVRVAPHAQISSEREATRRSLAFFAHLSDLHIADEASPARHEHLSAQSRAFGGFWRPQLGLIAPAPSLEDR